MLRVSMVGNSGSGKSTLARALGAKLGRRHLTFVRIRNREDARRLVDRATVSP